MDGQTKAAGDCSSRRLRLPGHSLRITAGYVALLVLLGFSIQVMAATSVCRPTGHNKSCPPKKTPTAKKQPSSGPALLGVVYVHPATSPSTTTTFPLPALPKGSLPAGVMLQNVQARLVGSPQATARFSVEITGEKNPLVKVSFSLPENSAAGEKYFTAQLAMQGYRSDTKVRVDFPLMEIRGVVLDVSCDVEQTAVLSEKNKNSSFALYCKNHSPVSVEFSKWGLTCQKIDTASSPASGKQLSASSTHQGTNVPDVFSLAPGGSSLIPVTFTTIPDVGLFTCQTNFEANKTPLRTISTTQFTAQPIRLSVVKGSPGDQLTASAQGYRLTWAKREPLVVPSVEIQAHVFSAKTIVSMALNVSGNDAADFHFRRSSSDPTIFTLEGPATRFVPASQQATGVLLVQYETLKNMLQSASVSIELPTGRPLSNRLILPEKPLYVFATDSACWTGLEHWMDPKAKLQLEQLNKNSMEIRWIAPNSLANQLPEVRQNASEISGKTISINTCLAHDAPLSIHHQKISLEITGLSQTSPGLAQIVMPFKLNLQFAKKSWRTIGIQFAAGINYALQRTPDAIQPMGAVSLGGRVVGMFGGQAGTSPLIHAFRVETGIDGRVPLSSDVGSSAPGYHGGVGYALGGHLNRRQTVTLFGHVDLGGIYLNNVFPSSVKYGVLGYPYLAPWHVYGQLGLHCYISLNASHTVGFSFGIEGKTLFYPGASYFSDPYYAANGMQTRLPWSLAVPIGLEIGF